MHTWHVDGRNPANQLRLVVYPIIYRVSHLLGAAGFLPWKVCLLCLLILYKARAILGRCRFLNYHEGCSIGDLVVQKIAPGDPNFRPTTARVPGMYQPESSIYIYTHVYIVVRNYLCIQIQIYIIIYIYQIYKQIKIDTLCVIRMYIYICQKIWNQRCALHDIRSNLGTLLTQNMGISESCCG